MVSNLLVGLASLYWGISNQGDPQRISIDHFTSGYVLGISGEDIHPPAPLENSPSVTVAVLDTGIDFTHPDLKDVLAGKGYNFVNQNDDASDQHGHGTHISGIIATQVSRHVRILPIKVVQTGPNAPIRPQSIEPGAGTALTENVAKGIVYAIENGAKVLNLSLAWPASIRSKKMDEAMKLAEEKEVLVVASAANDSTTAQLYPCLYRNVICVGAHGPDGSFTYFSNYGSMVDLLAPGIAILSTWPMNKAPVTFAGQIGYEFRNGTSMAAPFVAGALAELLSRGYSPKEAKNRLLLGTRTTRTETLYSTKVVGSFTKNRSKETKFSRFGNLDLTNALLVQPSSLVLPLEKGKIEVQWNGVDSLLSLTIPFQNQWKKAKSVRIETDGRSFDLGSQDENKIFDLEYPLEIGPQTESTINRQFKITTLEMDGRELTRVIPISFQINRIISPQTLPKNSIRYQLDLPWTKEPDSVRSVVFSTPSTDLELYLISKNELALTRNGVLLGKTSLPGITPDSILNLYHLDQDQYALVSAKTDRSSPRPTFYFHFFDSRLNLLSESKLGTETTVLNERFIWKKTQTGFTPLWISLGFTPDAQKPAFDPWNPNAQDPKIPRIYYVDPTGLRTLFLEGDELPIQILPNGSILISKGDSYFLRYFLLEINLESEEKKISKTELPLGSYRMFLGLDSRTPVLNLDGSPTLDFSMVGVSTPGNLRSSLIRGDASHSSNEMILRRSSTLESLIQVSGTFQTPDRRFYFVQSQYDLKFFRSDSNETSSVSLNRYSYIPAMIFLRSFFPTLAHDQYQKSHPAIYVPASVANGNVSEVILADPDTGDLSRPAALHLEGQGSCQGMGNLFQNPQNGETSQVFICGQEIVLVPLTIQK